MSSLNNINTNESEAPAYGFDAICDKFSRVYPNQTNPKHFGTLVSYKFGGNDPLEGISIYDGGEFWHFVTFGFSELFEKESDNTEWSGYGFELTLKLKKSPFISPENEDKEIKNIAGNLQSLARYVFNSGNIFDVYEYIYTKQQSGMDAERVSKLTGFATVPDECGTIDTPNGKVKFICLVGLTDKELLSINNKENTTKEILDLLGSDLTDYSRDDVI
jgi:hypothetical protein